MPHLMRPGQSNDDCAVIDQFPVSSHGLAPGKNAEPIVSHVGFTGRHEHGIFVISRGSSPEAANGCRETSAERAPGLVAAQ